MERGRPYSIGLALGGGTTFGLAHVGVLKALLDEEIPIDCISGTSAGAMVAAAFAFGLPLSDIIQMGREMKWRTLSRFGFSKLGISSNKRMGKFITNTLGEVHIEDAKIPLSIVATDIETHKMVILRSGSIDDAVRASTAIPGLFKPVEIEGRLLVDGGLSEQVPLTALQEMGATLKIGVSLAAHPPTTKRPKNVLQILSSSITILERHRDSTLLSRSDILIEPVLHEFDRTKFSNSEELMEEGYRAAMKQVPAIRQKIGPLETRKPSFLDKLRLFFQ